MCMRLPVSHDDLWSNRRLLKPQIKQKSDGKIDFNKYSDRLWRNRRKEAAQKMGKMNCFVLCSAVASMWCRSPIFIHENRCKIVLLVEPASNKNLLPSLARFKWDQFIDGCTLAFTSTKFITTIFIQFLFCLLFFLLYFGRSSEEMMIIDRALLT